MLRRYSFFHKSSKQDNIPLRLPNLNINGLTVDRESSIWRDHSHTVEKKNCKEYWALISRKVLPRRELTQVNLLCLHTCLSKLCKHSMD